MNALKKMDKKKAVKDLVAPVSQTPLIYERFLNHPEFVFPNYFMAKPGQRTTASTRIQEILKKKLLESFNLGDLTQPDQKAPRQF